MKCHLGQLIDFHIENLFRCVRFYQIEPFHGVSHGDSDEKFEKTDWNFDVYPEYPIFIFQK